MSMQRRLMWFCAIAGWLLITFPMQTRHDRFRAATGGLLLLASAVLSGKFSWRRH